MMPGRGSVDPNHNRGWLRAGGVPLGPIPLSGPRGVCLQAGADRVMQGGGQKRGGIILGWGDFPKFQKGLENLFGLFQ